MNFPNLLFRFTSARAPILHIPFRPFRFALYQPRHNVPRLICCCVSVAIGLTCFLFISCLFGSCNISSCRSTYTLSRNSIHQSRFFRLRLTCLLLTFLRYLLTQLMHPLGGIQVSVLPDAVLFLTPDIFDPVFPSSSFTNANDQILFRNTARKRFPALSPQEFLPRANRFDPLKLFRVPVLYCAFFLVFLFSDYILTSAFHFVNSFYLILLWFITTF